MPAEKLGEEVVDEELLVLALVRGGVSGTTAAAGCVRGAILALGSYLAMFGRVGEGRRPEPLL